MTKYGKNTESNDDIGKRAKELDEMEIIHRIRIGPKTMKRICIAVLIWIISIFIMSRCL